jgi:hypothetical protein
MSYKKILLQAFKTTWRNKYLWFFGLFATLLSQNGGFGVFFQLTDNSAEGNMLSGFMRYYETGVFSVTALKTLGNLIVTDPLSFIIFITVFLILSVLGLFLLWLAIVSQASLVNNSALDISQKKHSFREGLEVGMEKFWPVLGVNFLFKVISSAIVLIVTLPLFLSIYAHGTSLASVFFILLFLIAIPIVISISFIAKYAICFIVIKKESFKDSFYSALNLFKKNWVVSVEMGLLLLLINFLFGLAFVISILILSVPVLFIAFIFANLNFMLVFWLVLLFGLCLLFFLIILLGVLLTTFQTAAWTGIFMQLIGKGMKSKIMRFFAK